MSRDDLNSSTLFRMAVEVIVIRFCDSVLHSVSTALAGTVWETMQQGLHAATLFGGTSLCGIQQGTVGEAGVLKKIGTSEGGGRTWVHTGRRANRHCSGVRDHKGAPTGTFVGKEL